MAERDTLFGNIKNFAEKRASEKEAIENMATSGSIDAVKEYFTKVQTVINEIESTGKKLSKKKKEDIAQAMGFDPAMVNASKSYYAMTEKLEIKLNKTVKDRNINMKGAIKILLEENNIMRSKQIPGLDIVLDREREILKLLDKQYESRSRVIKLEGLSKKILGTTATSMMKASITGATAGGDKLGIPTRILGIVGGLVIGVISGLFRGILKLTTTFAETLTTIWDGGIQGILQATLNVAQQLASVFSDTLGKAIGAIGGLLIRVYMMRLEDTIEKSRAGALMRARTGGTEGAGKGLFGKMLDFTVVRKEAETFTKETIEAAGLGTEGARTNMAKTMFTLSHTLQMTATETAEFFKQSLNSYNNDITKATGNVINMFEKTREMASMSGLNAKELAKWIGNASIQARLLNVDMKTVGQEMSNLISKQKVLGAFGINLRTQGDQILKTMVDAPLRWSKALHAFMGMDVLKFGGKTGMERWKAEGRGDMSVGAAWLTSRYGIETALKTRLTKGGLIDIGTKTGARMVGETKEEGGLRSIQGMRTFVTEQTKDMKNQTDRLMVMDELLKNQFNVESEQARIAILSNMELGKLKNLDSIQATIFNERDLLAQGNKVRKDLYGISHRNEMIQRFIASLLPIIIALIIALPSKVASKFPMASKETEAGGKAFDELWDTFKEKMLNLKGPLKGVTADFSKAMELYEKTKLRHWIKSEGGEKDFVKTRGKEVKESQEKATRFSVAERKATKDKAVAERKATKDKAETAKKLYTANKEAYEQKAEEKIKEVRNAYKRGMITKETYEKFESSIQPDIKLEDFGDRITGGKPFLMDPKIERAIPPGKILGVAGPGGMDFQLYSQTGTSGAKQTTIQMNFNNYSSPQEMLGAIQKALAEYA